MMIYNIHELSWCWKFQTNPLYPRPKDKVILPHQCNFKMSTKTVKNIREPLKKPRPLKSTSVEGSTKETTLNTKARADLLAELEILNVRISNCDLDEIVTADIAMMCSLLKKNGEELDCVHKDALDRYFSTLRNICREDRLDPVSRLKLLEVIELRAMKWRTNENVTHYFSSKLCQLEEASENQNLSGSVSPNTLLSTQNQNFSTVALAPGEILRSSGKFSKPTKIAGKNYFKDEIVIRNCDSGKVMGIKGRRVHMIEELSDTVISFQRVNAGARDRLVQITGPREEAISHAKYLVEDTIKRNVSPVRDTELNVDNKEAVVDYGTSYFDRSHQVASSKRNLTHSYSMSDASSREFSVPVYVGNEVILLSGTKSELLKTAKNVLLQHFTSPSDFSEKEVNSIYSSKTTSSNNNQRFGLKKQVSLKDNLPSSFVDSSLSRQSSSSMSSSSDEVLPDEDTSEIEALAPIPPPSYVYSREFLLECARSVLSQKKPPDYECIAANFPEVIPQFPVMFEPSQWLEKLSL